jgi:hypothetical protein
MRIHYAISRYCRLHKKVLSYFKGMKLPFGKIRTADDG